MAVESFTVQVGEWVVEFDGGTPGVAGGVGGESAADTVGVDRCVGASSTRPVASFRLGCTLWASPIRASCKAERWMADY